MQNKLQPLHAHTPTHACSQWDIMFVPFAICRKLILFVEQTVNHCLYTDVSNSNNRIPITVDFCNINSAGIIIKMVALSPCSTA